MQSHFSCRLQLVGNNHFPRPVLIGLFRTLIAASKLFRQFLIFSNISKKQTVRNFVFLLYNRETQCKRCYLSALSTKLYYLRSIPVFIGLFSYHRVRACEWGLDRGLVRIANKEKLWILFARTNRWNCIWVRNSVRSHLWFTPDFGSKWIWARKFLSREPAATVRQQNILFRKFLDFSNLYINKKRPIETVSLDI